MVLQQPARSIPIPPLESGDRLTRAEFERHYKATQVNLIVAYCEYQLSAAFTVDGACNRVVFET
ncbi:hypothetical protein OsccyDRAFT_0228 [Leptolyngbyaceae cyanobacterium JSC-12]|nr:hypothetical protein OsccyDRAFT_0228 [Leptolyngbyaceae cyanobacterium JSC-12]